jgi:hypothetical protein
VASKRTVNALISGILFLVVAFVVGLITAAFTDSWVCGLWSQALLPVPR